VAEEEEKEEEEEEDEGKPFDVSGKLSEEEEEEGREEEEEGVEATQVDRALSFSATRAQTSLKLIRSKDQEKKEDKKSADDEVKSESAASI